MKSVLSALFAASAALALAGCGGDGAGSNANQAAPAASADGASAEASADAATPSARSAGTRIANRPHEALLRLDDSDRRITLVRAIRATRNRCPHRVEPNPVHQGEYEGMAYWTARCDNNEQYAVFIAPNEDVQVRNCRDMAELRLPACRQLPPAEPRRERPKAAAKS
ncbi:MAG TPA: hypothetical protein VF552_12820 [Allosphingosinicella sp.]|jgi:hypothetical protein